MGNGFGYASNDPINRIDPLGLVPSTSGDPRELESGPWPAGISPDGGSTGETADFFKWSRRFLDKWIHRTVCPAAMEEFLAEEERRRAEALEIWDLILSFVPFVGDVKDVVDFFTGTSLVRGVDLSGGERALSGLGIIIGSSAIFKRIGKWLGLIDEALETTTVAARTAARVAEETAEAGEEFLVGNQSIRQYLVTSCDESFSYLTEVVDVGSNSSAVVVREGSTGMIVSEALRGQGIGREIRRRHIAHWQEIANRTGRTIHFEVTPTSEGGLALLRGVGFEVEELNKLARLVIEPCE